MQAAYESRPDLQKAAQRARLVRRVEELGDAVDAAWKAFSEAVAAHKDAARALGDFDAA